MKRQFLLKILNPILFISILFQITTVILFQTPLDGEILDKMHGTNGFVLIGLIVIHLILNWPWIKSNIFKKK